MSCILLEDDGKTIPSIHYTQRTPPFVVHVRHTIDKSSTLDTPTTVELQVDTIPRVPGKHVVLTPGVVLLDGKSSEWTSVGVQPEQLSYHVGCDFQLEFYAVDPKTKERLTEVKPFITKEYITLKSKPHVEAKRKPNKSKHDNRKELETIKQKKNALTFWLKASVEYMQTATKQNEINNLEETPLQQLLVQQYNNLDI